MVLNELNFVYFLIFRGSRGPATRFSHRLRKLPVQFTGELPVITRKRRPKPVLPSVIIPEKPKGKYFLLDK